MIGERIRELRKHLSMNQEQFGARIGITKSAQSQIESGKNTPTVQTVKSICREFCVDENWLRTGEGDMFTAETRNDELERFISEIAASQPDEFRRRLVTALAHLTEREWEFFADFTARLVEQQPRRETLEEETRREAEEFYQKRLAEKKRALSSSQAAEDGNAG